MKTNILAIAMCYLVALDPWANAIEHLFGACLCVLATILLTKKLTIGE